MCKLSDLKTILDQGLQRETIVQKKEESGQHPRMDWLVFRSQTMMEKIQTDSWWLIVRMIMELEDDDDDNHNTH